MPRRSSLWVALLLGGCTRLVLAEPMLSEVVVSASGVPEDPSQTVTPVKVLGAAELAHAGSQTPLQLLQIHTGLAMGGEAFSIRGTNNNHTAVLVDGLRVNAVGAYLAMIDHLLPGMIERIEVVEGPTGGLYGSDALGGVIQLFTRNPDAAARPSLVLATGRWGWHRLSAAYSGRHGPADLLVMATHQARQGYSFWAPPANPDADGARHDSLFLKTRWRHGDRDLFSFQTIRLRERIDTDYTFENDRGTARSDFDGLRWQREWTEYWSSDFRLQRAHVVVGFDAFAPLPATTVDVVQATWNHQLQQDSRTWLLGVEGLEQRSRTAYLSQGDRTTHSAYVGLVDRSGRWSWQGNARFDQTNREQGNWSGLAGVRYQADAQQYYLARIATTVAQPALEYLYSINPLLFRGNPALLAEHARSVEFGAGYQWGAWHWAPTLFAQRVRNMIHITDDFTTYRNLPYADIRGLQSSVEYRGRNSRSRWFLTWQQPHDDQGQPLLMRSRRHAGFSHTFMRHGWQFGIDGNAIGPRLARYAGFSNVPGYVLLNAFASRKAGDLTWSLRINNLGNTRYIAVPTQVAPGRDINLSLTIDL